VHLLAPAKINWFLKVGRKRPDGYHEILSLMQFITLYDELSFTLSEDITVNIENPEMLNIPMEDNLVFKTALRLKEITGSKKGVFIKIKKEIPSGAGLGGGSSDAAVTLKGLNDLWSLGLKQKELMDIASEIGSDVPFFLNGPAAIVRGRGDIIEKIELKDSRILLLVKPDIRISSKWAYSEFDRIKGGEGNSPFNSPSYLKRGKGGVSGKSNSWDDHIINDLEEPVFMRYPELKEIKERLLKSGALYAAMTGSGSTLFGVFNTEEEAHKALLNFENLWTKVVKTIVTLQAI
jgi:4-diphosphocytidyl-2-C-methyl-D-erythritol kinase